MVDLSSAQILLFWTALEVFRYFCPHIEWHNVQIYWCISIYHCRMDPPAYLILHHRYIAAKWRRRKNQIFVSKSVWQQPINFQIYHNTTLQTSLILAHFFLYILLCPIHWSWTSFNARLHWIDAAIFVFTTFGRT